MKKVILGSVLAAAAAVSMNAAAANATICTGGNTASVTNAGSSNFVKTTFTARCSNNVTLVGNDTGGAYIVGATSVSKGRNAFSGSSVGGAITGTACTSTCAASDVTSAMATQPST